LYQVMRSAIKGDDASRLVKVSRSGHSGSGVTDIKVRVYVWPNKAVA